MADSGSIFLGKGDLAQSLLLSSANRHGHTSTPLLIVAVATMPARIAAITQRGRRGDSAARASAAAPAVATR